MYHLLHLKTDDMRATIHKRKKKIISLHVSRQHMGQLKNLRSMPNKWFLSVQELLTALIFPISSI